MSLVLNVWQKTHRFLITGGIMSLGDSISQLAIEKKPTFDWQRNARFACLGVCFVGPVLFNWYRLLDKLVPGHSGLAPFKKVFIDQLLMAPTVSFSIVSLLELMQGRNLQETKLKVITILPAIVANQYKVWPMIQLVNFYLIPLQYRLLYVNIAAFFWNIYLAHAVQAEKNISKS